MWYHYDKTTSEGVAITPISGVEHIEYASDTTIMREEVASDIGQVFGEVLNVSDIPLQVCC